MTAMPAEKEQHKTRIPNIKMGHREEKFRRTSVSLRIRGIPEGAEKDQPVSVFLHKFITTSLCIDLPVEAIRHAHRIGEEPRTSFRDYPRVILVYFNNSEDKERVVEQGEMTKPKFDGKRVQIDRNYPYEVFVKRRALQPTLYYMLNAGITAWLDYDQLKYIEDDKILIYKHRITEIGSHEIGSHMISGHLQALKKGLPMRFTKRIDSRNKRLINPAKQTADRLKKYFHQRKKHKTKTRTRQRDFKLAQTMPILSSLRSRYAPVPKSFRSAHPEWSSKKKTKKKNQQIHINFIQSTKEKKQESRSEKRKSKKNNINKEQETLRCEVNPMTWYTVIKGKHGRLHAEVQRSTYKQGEQVQASTKKSSNRRELAKKEGATEKQHSNSISNLPDQQIQASDKISKKEQKSNKGTA